MSKHERFAILHETEEFGQVLAVLQRDDEEGKPELRVFLQPPGLGVCSLKFGFKDTDEGWNKAEEALGKFDYGQALAVAEAFINQTRDLGLDKSEEDHDDKPH